MTVMTVTLAQRMKTSKLEVREVSIPTWMTSWKTSVALVQTQIAEMTGANQPKYHDYALRSGLYIHEMSLQVNLCLIAMQARICRII